MARENLRGEEDGIYQMSRKPETGNRRPDKII
jgi:hypothetical protein